MIDEPEAGVPGNDEELEIDDESINDDDFDDAEHSDDGEGGDGLDPANTDDLDEEEVAQPRVSRAQARIETALREAKAAREEAAAAKAEMEALRRGQSSAQDTERERLALENMDPYERLQYQSQKQASATEAKLARLEFTMADSADRTDFASKAARVPALASVADEVEEALKTMRAQGTTAPRETVAAYLLGQRAIQRGAGAKTRATKAGAARIASAAARPTGARSDVRAEGPRGDTRQARAKRLSDIQI